jgi:hypothetical protein
VITFRRSRPRGYENPAFQAGFPRWKTIPYHNLGGANLHSDFNTRLNRFGVAFGMDIQTVVAGLALLPACYFTGCLGMKNKQHITVLLSRFVAAVSACTRYCIRILQYTDMGDMGNMGNTDRETKNGRRFIIPYILFIFCPLFRIPKHS